MRKPFLLLSLLLALSTLSQGQVVIALIFGDKLNSDKLRFGIDGGVNFSNISNVGPSKYSDGFNLGLYFDLLLKKDKNWWIHTGVLLKSPMGAHGIQPYPISDTALYQQLDSGPINRKLRYFNVPILVRYKFSRGFFVEAGPNLGLLYKANDEFQATVNSKNDLSYTQKVLQEYNKIDAGVMGGIGYQLQHGTGVNFGLRYYYGLTNIYKDNPGNAQRNSSFYLFASIPIGAGEKAKAKNAEKMKERQEKKAKKEAEKAGQKK
jgi:hypothetical protein